MEIGTRGWLTIIGITLAACIGGAIVFLIIGAAWYAWGAIGALAFVFLVLGGWAWFYDRRQQEKYDRLPET
jgi:membrane protein implicated in regulation of membrane protease activity